MSSGKKVCVLGIGVSVTTPREAVAQVLDAAMTGASLRVTALASHGVMTGVDDSVHRQRLNAFDLVTPDGQPVRLAMNLLHQTAVGERTYGPDLMRGVCQSLAESHGAIALYGSTAEVIEDLRRALERDFPGLQVVFSEPSRFRSGDKGEFTRLAKRIQDSGARVCFVGLGCPRQEVFVYEMGTLLSIPVVAVGAAFDFLSGNASEPPTWVQDYGLQWFHRLLKAPRRLARRYLVLGPRFMSLVALQLLHVRSFQCGDLVRRSWIPPVYYL